jgi:hypothetical protein
MLIKCISCHFIPFKSCDLGEEKEREAILTKFLLCVGDVVAISFKLALKRLN